MDIFQIDEKLCLLKSFLKKYTNTMRFFHSELTTFCTNKYIIEKIRDFPFHIFGESDRDVFFNAVANAFFHMCLNTAFKLSNDQSESAYTMKSFRNDLIKNVKKKYKKQFSLHLKDIKFDKKLNVVFEKVEPIRNKALAHNDALYVKNKLNLQGISWSDFDIIENNLSNAFNGLSLNVIWELLPISYDPSVHHPNGTDPRPDIVKFLDYIAKESQFLNLPEKNPITWKYELEVISKEDLKIFNCYRRKNNLKTF